MTKIYFINKLCIVINSSTKLLAFGTKRNMSQCCRARYAIITEEESMLVFSKLHLKLES